MQNFRFKKVKAVRIPGLNTHLARSPLGFPGGSVGKESDCHAGELGSIPGLGRCPWRRRGYPYSGLENPMHYIVNGVAKSQTGLSDFHIHRITSRWVYTCRWAHPCRGHLASLLLHADI